MSIKSNLIRTDKAISSSLIFDKNMMMKFEVRNSNYKYEPKKKRIKTATA